MGVVLRTSLLYRCSTSLANALLPLFRWWSPKLATGDRERRAALGRWRRWAADARDRSRPLLWIHAPSVGEGLQAQAVLAELRPRHPDWQIVFSFFSPSAATLATRQPVDHADYLPYDIPPNVDAMLAAVAPTALVFTKADLWPELATRARARGVAVGMVAATVSPVSGRQGLVARRLTAAGYRALDRAGAIAEEDAARLTLLGTSPERIVVTGDPRFDSAAARAAAMPQDWPHRRLVAGGPTLVAGSTWPPDESVLLDAFALVRPRHSDARLVIVPHEPTDSAVSAIEAMGRRAGVDTSRLSRLADGARLPPVVVVDQIGLLAWLYRDAAIGFVGGGFGRSGLHSVLEPAACGVPVVFGPAWQASREAGLLLESNAARALARQDQAAGDLAAIWAEWLEYPDRRIGAGAKARAMVTAGIGGAPRGAALIEALMEQSAPPRE